MQGIGNFHRQYVQLFTETDPRRESTGEAELTGHLLRKWRNVKKASTVHKRPKTGRIEKKRTAVAGEKAENADNREKNAINAKEGERCCEKDS